MDVMASIFFVFKRWQDSLVHPQFGMDRMAPRLPDVGVAYKSVALTLTFVQFSTAQRHTKK